MANKKNALILVLAIAIGVFALNANALVDVTYNFNANNVQIEAYDCADANCDSVNAFSGSFPNGKTTTNGQLTIRYPSTLATPNGYAVYYFTSGNVPQAYKATWNSGGNTTLFSTSFNINFAKVANCKATVQTLDIANQVQP